MSTWLTEEVLNKVREYRNGKEPSEYYIELLNEKGKKNIRIQRLAEAKASERSNNVSQKRKNEIRHDKPIKELNWLAYAQLFEV